MDNKEKKLKFYQFQHSDGADIIVAEFGRQAMNYYLNNYQDDTTVDDILDTGGLRVRELTDQEINRVRKIYNEDKSDYELLSYKDVAEEVKAIPDVIITPNY